MRFGTISIAIEVGAIVLVLAAALLGSGRPCGTPFATLLFLLVIPAGVTGLLGVFLDKRKLRAVIGLLLALGLIIMLFP